MVIRKTASILMAASPIFSMSGQISMSGQKDVSTNDISTTESLYRPIEFKPFKAKFNTSNLKIKIERLLRDSPSLQYALAQTLIKENFTELPKALKFVLHNFQEPFLTDHETALKHITTNNSFAVNKISVGEIVKFANGLKNEFDVDVQLTDDDIKDICDWVIGKVDKLAFFDTNDVPYWPRLLFLAAVLSLCQGDETEDILNDCRELKWRTFDNSGKIRDNKISEISPNFSDDMKPQLAESQLDESQLDDDSTSDTASQIQLGKRKSSVMLTTSRIPQLQRDRLPIRRESLPPRIENGIENFSYRRSSSILNPAERLHFNKNCSKIPKRTSSLRSPSSQNTQKPKINY